MLNLASEQPFYGYVFEGETFDCGSKAGFIRANIAFAMDDDEVAGEVREELARHLG
jgi:UTP--glucose-1-phosphate uridylyltransferase